MSLKTPTEILEDNPEIRNFWTINDLGYFHSKGLLSGYKTRRGCQIEEVDVINLYEYLLKTKNHG